MFVFCIYVSKQLLIIVIIYDIATPLLLFVYDNFTIHYSLLAAPLSPEHTIQVRIFIYHSSNDTALRCVYCPFNQSMPCSMFLSLPYLLHLWLR
jgi:hypothetical protein